MAQSSVTFIFLLNRMIQLGDDVFHFIPCRNVEQTITSPQGDRTALFPVFNMDKQHVVSLGELSPNVPRRRPEWTDSFFAKIEEAAFTTAIEKRAKAAHIIKNLKQYVRSGVIEIVDDPEGLLEDESTVSDVERTLAGLPPDVPARDVTVIRTDELAVEAAALRSVK